MRALVDRVEFVSEDEVGTLVRLEKDLAYLEDSLLAKAPDGGRS